MTGLSPTERIRGAVLGAAIGDALGHPTEFRSVQAIRQEHGPRGVRGYTLHWEADGRRFAPFTDDTQMSECVLEALIAGRRAGWGLDRTMEDLAGRFVRWAESPRGGHRSPGTACMAGCRALAGGASWRVAGGADAGGCGSVMRAWPVGLMCWRDPVEAERWAVAQSLPTHRDPIALAASAGLAVGVAAVLAGADLAGVCREMIDAASRQDPRTGGMMGRALAEARGDADVDVVLDRLRAWAAHEAIAGSLFLFVRYLDRPDEGMLAGANAPGDSDSLASIAGALLGAWHGAEALPTTWVEEIERREDLEALASAVAELAG